MAVFSIFDRIAITRAAGADLSGWQYRWVRLSGVYAVKTQSARGDIIGVLLNKPDARDKSAQILLFGVGKVKTDGGVSVMEWLMSDASGRADTATPGTGTAVNVGGRALETDGGAGSIIQAFINPQVFEL